VAKEYKKEFAPLATPLNTLLDDTSENNRRKLRARFINGPGSLGHLTCLIGLFHK
jgi:hypothetical protein